MVNSTVVMTRLALPKGKMLARTAQFLEAVGLGFDDYNSKTRIYRMQSQKFPSLSAKMLNERDIPVQVAIGNYDIGICSFRLAAGTPGTISGQPGFQDCGPRVRPL